MKIRALIPVVLVCGGLAVSGCETLLGNELTVFDNETVTAEGVRPIIVNENFETIDLIALLTLGTDAFSPEQSDLEQRKHLELAFDKFYESLGADQKRKRNSVQDRILAASNQRCNRYKRYLKRVDSQTNLILGSLSTILGGAGAIFTGVDTVRALSGAAGIISGVRAEFNDSYFSSLALQVVTNGIESERQELLEAITGIEGNANKPGKQSKEIADYTVEAAIRDAIKYHGACSLLAGLERAALDVQRARDPGLKRLNPVLEELRKASNTLDAISGKGVGQAVEALDKEINDPTLDATRKSELQKIRVLLTGEEAPALPAPASPAAPVAPAPAAAAAPITSEPAPTVPVTE